VFTPAGDVKVFPQGATALDFAYAVHTEVGNTCTGAKVNGRMVPLRYELGNGDRIEILTNANQQPNRDWLEIARTGRALSKIRRHIREEERDRGRRMGQQMLEGELKKNGLNLNKLLRNGKLKEVARKHGQRKPEQLYLELGQGSLSVGRVLQDLLPPGTKPVEAEPTGAFNQLLTRLRGRSQSPVTIDGEDEVMVAYAQCCSPLPGEPVAGFVTRGRGITVHLASCPQLLAMESERRIDVQWKSRGVSKHTGEVKVVCADKPGMLADIGAICKTDGINITRMDVHMLEDNKAVCSLEVAVRDVSELSRLMRNIEKIKGVISVGRVRATRVR
ncbi:MAG: TGS domain-containing protein, partial [Myxococcota bacterium]|nr:TGS domain-containing protein [Myxococcota bacterium]